MGKEIDGVEFHERANVRGKKLKNNYFANGMLKDALEGDLFIYWIFYICQGLFPNSWNACKQKKAPSETNRISHLLAAGSSFSNLYSNQKVSIQFNIAPKTMFAGFCFECGWLVQVLVMGNVKDLNVLKELDQNRI